MFIIPNPIAHCAINVHGRGRLKTALGHNYHTSFYRTSDGRCIRSSGLSIDDMTLGHRYSAFLRRNSVAPYIYSIISMP